MNNIIHIQVELTRTSGSRTPVINYTEIQFDLSCCSVQVTTTTEPIKGSTGSMTTTNGKQIICVIWQIVSTASVAV